MWFGMESGKQVQGEALGLQSEVGFVFQASSLGTRVENCRSGS